MHFSPNACQFFGAQYIREWSRGRPRESESGRKNERTILPEKRQGHLRYNQKCIPVSGKTAQAPYKLLNKLNKFDCGTERKKEELKKKLLEALVSRYPNEKDSYTSTTYASLTGIGAIFTQK